MSTPPDPESLLPEKPTPEMIKAASDVALQHIEFHYYGDGAIAPAFEGEDVAMKVLEAALEAYHRKRREQQPQA